MPYHNLDLWIEPKRDDGYPLRANCTRHGESHDLLALDPAELVEAQRALEEGETDRDFLIAFGSRLHGALFSTPQVGPHFHRCSGAARRPRYEGVRLRLRIEPPEIAALPWEYLYSPSDECFLGASISTPLVRYLELPQRIRALATPPPLRMLVLIPEESGLDAAREKAHLLEALQNLQEQVQLTFLERRVTRTAISDLLLEERFHLIHFIGHGDFEEDRAILVLNGENGEEDRVDHERFASLFLNHPSLKLVVLNACEGARVSETRSLLGMAPQIVKQGIPAVVAMQYAIYDAEAIRFAREFYRSLFRSRDHGRVEVAMAHARNTLGAEFRDSRAVGAPVLFMRTPEGVLFDVKARHRLRQIPFALGAVHRLLSVFRTHQHNLRLLHGEPREDDPEVETAIREEEDELARIRRRLRFRNLSLAAAVGVALIGFFLLWMGVFDRLPRWLQLESYSVWIGDAFADKTMADEIALVGIGRRAEERVDRVLGPSWRAEHAAVVDSLSSHGARVIAFDMYFPSSTPADSAFARAIQQARERGTTVIVGSFRVLDGQPEIAATLRGALREWGVLCVGRTAVHSAKSIPLYVVPAGAPQTTGHSSLALRSVAAYDSARVLPDLARREVNLAADNGDLRHVGVTQLTPIRSAQPRCPAIGPGDLMAEMIIDYSPLEALRDPVRRSGYEEILYPAAPDALERFRGRIVLIGDEVRGDTFRVWRGLTTETRHGYEIHADAINTILRGVTIRPLSRMGQFLVLLLLALLAAMIVYLIPERARLRLGVLALVLLAYLATAVYLYTTQRLLLITLYHVAALLLSYALVRTLQQRWFP